MSSENYSLLRQCKPPRPLPIALAQVMANAAASDPRWPAFGRLFNGLRMVDRLRCQDELRWCRMAKRGALEARVA